MRNLFIVGFVLVTIFNIGCDQFLEEESMPPTEINDVNAIAIAVNIFKKDNNRYPAESEGLLALMEKPIDIKNTWSGPYLDRIKKDPWGNNYIYKNPGLNNTQPFIVYSFGPNGVDDMCGSDDVCIKINYDN